MSKSAQIAKLNDMFRTAFGAYGGKVLQTIGISSLSQSEQSTIREAVETYTDFNKGNDPHKEHDFGSLTHNGHRVFWKIDYYDKAYEYASEDPSDSSKTNRVLTIMMADEY